jgi:uncharacterized membrane protein
MARLRSSWQTLTAAFWFVPSAVTAAYVLLAFALIEVDKVSEIKLGFDGDASAARGILSTIAGSLITVAGLSFSLTIVTLQLVSQQFTPRALRGLLADRVNQVVAGSFVGIFAYCLLVLRVIRTGNEARDLPFVPGLAVSAAIVLALFSLFLLLVFIHHMGRSIQVSTIAARIAGELDEAIDRLYPGPFGEPADEATPPWETDGEPGRVTGEKSGFVQRLELGVLASGAPEGTCVRIPVAPGDFVTQATVLLEVWPSTETEAIEPCLAQAVVIADERDIVQDTRFGIRQLVDIALRAVSPGINDPTTALTCVGYLQGALERLAARDFPAQLRRGEGTLVEARRPDFAEHVELAFVELGRYADARVAGSLLAALAAVAEAARRAGATERLEVIRKTAARVVEQASLETSGSDRASLEAQAAAIR